MRTRSDPGRTRRSEGSLEAASLLLCSPHRFAERPYRPHPLIGPASCNYLATAHPDPQSRKSVITVGTYQTLMRTIPGSDCECSICAIGNTWPNSAIHNDPPFAGWPFPGANPPYFVPVFAAFEIAAEGAAGLTASFSAKSRRAFSGSASGTGPSLVKFISISPAGVYAGHFGSEPPLGSPVFTKFAQ